MTQEGDAELTPDCFQQRGELLTQDMSSIEVAELSDSMEGSHISLVNVTEVFKKFCSGKAPEVDNIQPEMLKTPGCIC